MNYGAIIEAILFTMGDSVELSKLAEVLEQVRGGESGNYYYRIRRSLPDVYPAGDV